MKNQKNILTFNAIFEQEEDGGYSVQVPSLPGCFSEGDTFEKAVGNIKEAINLYLEEEKQEDITYFGHRAEREFIVPVKIPHYA